MNTMKLGGLLAFVFSLQHVSAQGITKELCLTAFTSTSTASVPTSTLALTVRLPRKVVVTVTPSTIVTPPATTTTTTTTTTETTTLPVVTDTFTSVVTNTVTNTATTTSVTTSNTVTTTTTTLAPSASTVPVPNGFKFPNPTPGAPQKRSVEIIRHQRDSIMARAVPDPSKLSYHCPGSPNKYAKKVQCLRFVASFVESTSTKTASTTTTIFLPTPTSEATSTVTTTVTTSLPNASTTTTTTTVVTTATTTTVVSTSVNTQTVTATSTPPPSATIYAACLDPRNQASRDSQGRLLELEAAYVPSTLSYTANAYDCCVACFQTPNCYGANYGDGFGQQSCELEIGSSCPANQDGLGGFYSYQRAGNIPVTVSNGPCGRYKYQETF